MTPLPPPREPGRYRIEMVCSGNICRSPSAAVVLTALVDRAGLSDEVTIGSSGLGAWHVGDPMDERSAAELTAAGYDPTAHRARQWRSPDLATADLVLAMDHTHLRDLPRDDRVRMFRDWDPVDPGGDVPDPYYGGPEGFEEVLTMVERTCIAIVASLERAHPEWQRG